MCCGFEFPPQASSTTPSLLRKSLSGSTHFPRILNCNEMHAVHQKRPNLNGFAEGLWVESSCQVFSLKLRCKNTGGAFKFSDANVCGKHVFSKQLNLKGLLRTFQIVWIKHKQTAFTLTLANIEC